MKNILKLFETIVGSHMWGMDHEGSDLDICCVYLMDSRDWVLGKRPKGKQVFDGEIDTTYYELDVFMHNLMKGNVNYVWGIMTPIKPIMKYKSAFTDLRAIVSTNLAKNIYHSINGMAKHNIKHFIDGGDRQSHKYKKKLNTIGRSLKFGINLLVWGKTLFEKVEVKSDRELYDLKFELDRVFKNSTLQEKPNQKLYEDFYVKWRLHKLDIDRKKGLI